MLAIANQFTGSEYSFLDTLSSRHIIIAALGRQSPIAPLLLPQSFTFTMPPLILLVRYFTLLAWAAAPRSFLLQDVVTAILHSSIWPRAFGSLRRHARLPLHYAIFE